MMLREQMRSDPAPNPQITRGLQMAPAGPDLESMASVVTVSMAAIVVVVAVVVCFPKLIYGQGQNCSPDVVNNCQYTAESSINFFLLFILFIYLFYFYFFLSFLSFLFCFCFCCCFLGCLFALFYFPLFRFCFVFVFCFDLFIS